MSKKQEKRFTVRSTAVFFLTAVILVFMALVFNQCKTKMPQMPQMPPIKVQVQTVKKPAPLPVPTAPGKIQKEDLSVEFVVEEGIEGSFVGGTVCGVGAPTGDDLGVNSYSSIRCAPAHSFNTEEYNRIYENRFLTALDNPLSTFSIDVDTGSYSNIRRYLNDYQLPPKDAVRIEEMINYFEYDYPEPDGIHPFSITAEMSACPWEPSHFLLHIGIRGKSIASESLPLSNLVFLLDVSGSMEEPDKLPLLVSSFKLLVPQLSDGDKVAVVVYAGAAGLVLPSVPGNQKDVILAALDKLTAGGCTAGSAGIRLAYQIASENFIPNGNNRIILATDGDFNIGVSSTSELIRLIEEKRENGIFLTTLGFGSGNLKDNRLEQLADKGNGSYHYIDNILEGKKVFVHDLKSTLFTIAKDVKIQVEFNPAKVESYRLVGYENRVLAKEDFADDKKDAGELGAGHTVTALYEIIPCKPGEKSPASDPLRFQETSVKAEAFNTGEMALVKLRYKQPQGEESQLVTQPVLWEERDFKKSPENIRFSAAVVMFGMLLRESEYAGDLTYDNVLAYAKDAIGPDRYGYRGEFLHLVSVAKRLKQ